jgi:hypothetical protein
VSLLAEALMVNSTLAALDLVGNSFGAAGSAAMEAAVSTNPVTLGPVTPAQRLAFFCGHLRRPSLLSSITKLPLDMVRRILTGYKVARGRRSWNGENMYATLPNELHRRLQPSVESGDGARGSRGTANGT